VRRCNGPPSLEPRCGGGLEGGVRLEPVDVRVGEPEGSAKGRARRCARPEGVGRDGAVEPPRQEPAPAGDDPTGPAARWLWFGMGWVFLGLGLLGAALPVLPTTPFLLLALWAFSRSSQRFHDWLYHHRVLGPPLQRWRRERVVPARVKAVAILSMLASLAWVTFGLRAPWYGVLAMVALVAFAVAFLARLPSRASEGPPGAGDR